MFCWFLNVVEQGFLGGSAAKNLLAPKFDPWGGKIPWRSKCLYTPVFLPGKSHGQRSLAGYSLWCWKRVRHNLASKQQQQNVVETLSVGFQG